MTRRSAIAILALCGLAAPITPAVAQAPAAPAAPAGPLVKAPAGWAPQPVRLAPPRPDVTATRVETYYPPADAPGPRAAALYVTRIERAAAADRRDAIASGELEEIFAAQRRQGAGAKTEASARRADTAAHLLEAQLTWRDAGAGVVDASRVLVAADAQRVVAVTGQCLLAATAPAEIAKACEAALATLDPGIPAAARVPLSMSAEPAPVEAPPAMAAVGSAAAPAPAAAAAAGAPAPSGPAPATAGPAPARMTEPSYIRPIPEGARALEPDRRPVYLGLGLVVLALIFWWNRKRRERFEADDEDLHAAADEPAAPPADKEKDA